MIGSCSDIIINHLDQQLNEAQAEIHRLAQQNLSLRKSLEILVGASSKEELQEIRDFLKTNNTKTELAIKAIDTLLSLD